MYRSRTYTDYVNDVRKVMGQVPLSNSPATKAVKATKNNELEELRIKNKRLTQQVADANRYADETAQYYEKFFGKEGY